MRKFHSISIRNERQLIAFTGMSEKIFDRLLAEFTQCLNSDQQKKYHKNRARRHRKPGGGRRGILATPELKLFYILFYLKNYPTFDVLGGVFDLSLSKARENVTKLLPILKQAEKNLHVLPHRHFLAPSKPEKTKEIQMIIVDATERPRQRPQHARKQKNGSLGSQ